jgi:hypothetical protein
VVPPEPGVLDDEGEGLVVLPEPGVVEDDREGVELPPEPGVADELEPAPEGWVDGFGADEEPELGTWMVVFGEPGTINGLGTSITLVVPVLGAVDAAGLGGVLIIVVGTGSGGRRL